MNAGLARVMAKARRGTASPVDVRALVAIIHALADALRSQRCSQCVPSEPDEDVCDACRAKRAALRDLGGFQ